MTRFGIFAVICSTMLSSSALANGALPSGKYVTSDGGGAMVHANAQGWQVSDASMPDIRIQGDYRGGCQVFAMGQVVPCQAQVQAQSLRIYVPAIQTTVALRYAGARNQSAPVNPGGFPAQPQAPSFNGGGFPAQPQAPSFNGGVLPAQPMGSQSSVSEGLY